MVERANRLKRPLAPTLTAKSLRRIARGVVGSALARAQLRYGVEVYALVVMSSHIHLVARTSRKNLSKFMGYVNAQVAKSVNRITGKRGGLWARRYDAQPILDDAAAETLTAYTLRNPVAAKLVERHDEWPGLNLAYGVAETDDLDFEWLNCSAWHRANRPGDLSPYFETVTLRLSPLPHCADFERAAYGHMLKAWLAELEANETSGEQLDSRLQPSGVLGLRRVVETAFEARSERMSLKRRPYAFGSPEAKAKERAMMHLLSEAHARASEAWCAGNHAVAFPVGTYRPPIACAA